MRLNAPARAEQADVVLSVACSKHQADRSEKRALSNEVRCKFNCDNLTDNINININSHPQLMLMLPAPSLIIKSLSLLTICTICVLVFSVGCSSSSSSSSSSASQAAPSMYNINKQNMHIDNDNNNNNNNNNKNENDKSGSRYASLSQQQQQHWLSEPTVNERHTNCIRHHHHHQQHHQTVTMNSHKSQPNQQQQQQRNNHHNHSLGQKQQFAHTQQHINHQQRAIKQLDQLPTVNSSSSSSSLNHAINLNNKNPLKLACSGCLPPIGRSRRVIGNNRQINAAYEAIESHRNGARELRPEMSAFRAPLERNTDYNLKQESYENNERAYDISGRQNAEYHHQPYTRAYDEMYENKSSKQRLPFEPKSDEKCPMTGTLTLCDDINSYPAEIILHKLESAKKALKQGYFNLDSLFSDERDHLSDPFDDDADKSSTRSASSNPPFSANNSPQSTNSTQIYYKQQPYLHHSTSTNTHLPPTPHVYHNINNNYNNERAFNRLLRQDTGSRSSASRNARLVSDEFVDLVERRAISLKQQQQQPQSVHLESSEEQGEDKHSNEFVQEIELSPASIEQQHQFKSELELSTKSSQLDHSASVHYKLSSTEPSGVVDVGGSSIKGVDVGVKHVQRINSTASSSSLSPSKVLRALPPTVKSHAAQVKRREHNNKQAHPQSLSVTSTSLRAPQALMRSRRQASDEGEGGANTSQDQPDDEQSGSERAAAASGARDTNQVQPNSESSSRGEEDSSRSSGSDSAPFESVCRAKSIYISPRAALNDQKQWKYVVNAPERNPQIRQIVRVDICEDPFGPCSNQVTLPFGFTSQCKQKYSKKKLLALDAESGLLEVDTFFIPSCCVCQLIRDSQPTNSNVDSSTIEENDDNNNSTPSTINETNQR